MKPLDPPDSLYLLAAQGWHELGNQEEACRELQGIAPPLQTHPVVLAFRVLLAAKLQDWETCVATGNALVEAAPEQSDGWIYRSVALHELGRTQEALEMLIPAVDRFPQLWIVPYNLACFLAQLGRLTDARRWLDEALAIPMRADDHQRLRSKALFDQDLEPLWQSLPQP